LGNAKQILNGDKGTDNMIGQMNPLGGTKSHILLSTCLIARVISYCVDVIDVNPKNTEIPLKMYIHLIQKQALQ
jgi:hypothetical protein